MSNLFISILTISLQATIAAVIVILYKKVFASRINVRIGYFLWILVFLRLVFPVLPESPLSIFNAIDFDLNNKIFISHERINETNFNVPSQVDIFNDNSDVDLIDGSTRATVEYEKTATSASPTKLIATDAVTYFSYIWAIGAIIIFIYLLFANLLFALRIRKMTGINPPAEIIKQLKAITKLSNRKISFVESNDISSPSVFGIFKYTILLPKDFLENAGNKTISYVLVHEFAHIKNGDLIVCWLYSLVCALHWFNPVMWYTSKLIKRDQELCADSYTMSVMDEEDFSGYGQALLSIISQDRKKSPALITAGITESKKTLKQRIVNIAVFSKRKYRISFISILLIAAAGVFLCTSQMNYPGTAGERMEFDDNIIMSFDIRDLTNPENFELKIANDNKIAIHSCKLEIYNNNSYKKQDKPVYEINGFGIAGDRYKVIKLENINYNNAFVKFSYKTGIAFDDSNIMGRSGDLRAIDSTLTVEKWTPASNEEIEAFIDENNIKSIAINRIYNFYTIVIFDNGGSSGYYELYKDSRSDELKSRRILGYNSGNKAPVQIMGGTASGNYPFVNFKINSPALKALGDRIEIHTKNGIITVHNSLTHAYTVPTRGYGNVDKVLIYDKEDRLLFDGVKSLFSSVEFKPDDPSYLNIAHERGYEIVNQSPVSHEISFTPGMFPQEYIVAHESQNIDWKIPLFIYENTTVYLRSIVESNESPDYLYALFYFIHNVQKPSGKILSSVEVNFKDGTPYSYGSNVNPERDAISIAGKNLINTVSLRSSGPGDQITIYLKKSMVEETKGKFTVVLDGLNEISYIKK